MFQRRNARLLLPLGALACSALLQGGCDREKTPEAPVDAQISRAELLAAPPGSPQEVLDRARANAALDDDAVRDISRQHRDARERARLLAAAGPPIELRGRVVSAIDGKPEADCLVSHDGQEAYADEQGNFALFAIPSDGQIRLRMRCKGLVERHNVVIPAIAVEASADAVYTLPEPIEVGRRLRPTPEDEHDPVAHPAISAVFDGAVGDLAAPRTAAPTAVDGTAIDATIHQNATTPKPAAVPLPTAQPSGSAAGPPPASSGAARPPATPAVPVAPRIPVQPEQIVVGSLSAEDIAPELRRRAAALHSCYAVHLESHRDDVEAVRVRWVISPTGNPESVEILGSTFDAPEQDLCVARRLTRLAFPASDGTTTVTQTFVFGFRLVPDAQIP